VSGVREVGYRILSHGALPLDLRSNAGILYVAACGEDDRQLLPGTYIFLVSVELQQLSTVPHGGMKELTMLRVDSVTRISISISFISCIPLLHCNLFLFSVGN
jgi:hypothetical protein